MNDALMRMAEQMVSKMEEEGETFATRERDERVVEVMDWLDENTHLWTPTDDVEFVLAQFDLQAEHTRIVTVRMAVDLVHLIEKHMLGGGLITRMIPAAQRDELRRVLGNALEEVMGD